MFHKNKSSTISRDDKFAGIPGEFHLEQNVPNPFNTKTTICFSIPRQCNVKLVIYNLHEEVESVLYNRELSPGKYSMIWHGSDANGYPLKDGSYLYYLEAESFIASRRLTIRRN